ncbi:glutaminyl-peptide cyclotransferase-like a isoform X2 [Nerophis ophidion]|uniref:glutaminyl-peptide cyclotransferase-like a isoform X2 n=1 Tax=Nerophis ophidion TaxID=159077 RepID=UPI002AE0152C|nr:glutaminyl-peptide cyclotransferase-like a isoform X2 [Nerophis ophidion]
MGKFNRRFKALPQGKDCDRPMWRRVRVLMLCLLVVLLLSLGVGVYHLSNNSIAIGHADRILAADLTKDRLLHKPSKSSPAQIRRLASQVDGTRLWETHLKPILIERLPGTGGSLVVQQHITSALSSLSAGWDVHLDSFRSPTPRGKVTFTNIVATLDPSAPRRLLLACHYDSKALPADRRAPKRVFLGASDSAVPCAMILELATSLDNQLRSFKEQDLFVLLDLLGGPDPLIVNHFDNTARWFDRLIAAERRLHRQGLLASHPLEQTYFRKDIFFGAVQDDHIPFLHRGVPVLHVIATPFPKFWHTLDDTEENMHRPTVENLTKIMAVFLAEYLGL